MEYFQPQDLKSALHLLKQRKKKTILIAGGTNIIPDLRTRAIYPKILIDLSRLSGLSYIKEDNKKIRVGALTPISELTASRIIQKSAPILFQACNQLGNPLVRNRATLAGNLADASPAADTAVPLLALEADLLTNQRRISINQFFIGPNQTILKKDEIIKEIIFLKPNARSRMGYFKLGLRNAMAISVVSVAVLMEWEGTFCKKVRIGLGAVAPKPIRAYRTEEMLMGKEITSELIEACGHEVADEVRPITDIRASAEYRREMASVGLRRLIQEIASDSRDAESNSA
jgi:carbon-monoxide dehydrogenase medium subunit